MLSILNVLNEEQLAAVKEINGPVMVFAGAGTGKTKTLTARIAYMVSECNIKPYNILAITFTKKATNEMKERLFGILEGDAKFLNISTIHSLCVKILRRDIDHLGYSRNFEIIDDEDSQKVIIEIMKKNDIDRKTSTPKAVQAFISDFKNGIGTITNYMRPIYEAYEAELKKTNSLDFDDLLLKTEELFKKFPEVLEYYQDYYKYILVDEFQDTNRTQYEIVKMLAAKYQNIFVVGDDDQSIYSFRGACVENMLGFKDDFPNTKVFKLQENYRSTDAILKGANAVIANNNYREPKQLYSKIKGSPDNVIIKEAFYYENEVRYVVNEINHLVSTGYCNYSQIAVLYRNSVISYNFEKAFLEDRIPYNIFGGYAYLKRKEVKDIISYFRFICDSNRLIHFKRIINLEPRGIGDKTILHVQEIMESEHLGLLDAIQIIFDRNSSAKNQSLIDFKNQIIDFQAKIETMNLPEFFDYLMDKTGYLKALKEEDGLNGSDRASNALEFRSILANMEKQYDGSGLSQKEKINLGIDELLLAQSVDEDEKPDAVTLSTVHSIKGLEFEVVFVVALEEGIFPSVRDDIEVEEERRVAYVAFTRAKSRIYLTCSQRRLIYGRVVTNRISRFLNEYLTSNIAKPNIEESKTKADEESVAAIKVGSKVNHKYFGYGTVVAKDENFVQIIFEKSQEIKKIKIDYPDMSIVK